MAKKKSDKKLEEQDVEELEEVEALDGEELEELEEFELEEDLYDHQYNRFMRLLEGDWEKAISICGMFHVHSLTPEEKMEMFEKFGYEAREPQEFYNRGVQAALEEDYETAEKYFKQSIEEDPEFNEAIYNLALTYERVSNFKKSLELWQLYQERIGSKHPDYSSVRSHIRTLKNKV